MKDILTAPFVEEMRAITSNMYRMGWDSAMAAISATCWTRMRLHHIWT